MSKISTINFKITGMHCASCATNSQRMLSKVPGVQSAEVSYATEHATVSLDTKTATISDLRQAVASLGYKAQITESNTNQKIDSNSKHINGLHIKLFISILLTTPLVLAMIPGMPMWLMDPRLQLLLATPVQFWINGPTYTSAWRALKNGMSNMDTLIALGTSVAYFYSLSVVIFSDQYKQLGIDAHVYFETSAAIITLIVVGKYLEARAKGKASDAIKKLLNLQVKKARVIKNGIEQEMPIDQVMVNDVIKIKPGEKIPVDGVILKGSASINESMVTGESLPVYKTIHDLLIGSTINTNGTLIMKATKVGSDTFLAQIVELVKQAQGSRAPIQKIVDQVSSIFVPAVIILSIIAFILWFTFGPDPVLVHAMLAMIAVLIIACPCALGLATPTSIMVGVGKGAEVGILIKDAHYLERAGKITAVVFDKTGTLTEGKPELQQVLFHSKIKKQSTIEQLIVSLESESHHPLAKAVVSALSSKHEILEVDKFQDKPGRGIQGYVNGSFVLIGTKAYLLSHKVHFNQSLLNQAEQLSNLAKTTALVAVAGQLVAVLSISDTTKPASKEVIAQLHQLNIQSVMITGDNRQTAQAVADQIGIDQVIAEVLPKDKKDIIRQMQKNGEIVAMVGDGINDAPSLAAADIGIAMGNGTDVAIETAGITLLRSDISLVPKAIKLSKATLNNIKQNLFWAFGYNTLLIPVAMGILYPFFGIQLNPILASAAMALSSISVVTNALRLKKVDLQ